jgi:sec-independent protein translocase protein TatB
MFGVGTGELILIMVLALVVLGPDKLPNAARQAGQWMAELRRISGGFQSEFRRAVDSAMDDTDYSEFKLPDLPKLSDMGLGSSGDSYGTTIETDVPAAPPALDEPAVSLDKAPAPEPSIPPSPSAPSTAHVDVDGPSSSFS